MIHDTLRGILLFGPCTLPRSLFRSLALRVLCAPWPLSVCPLSPAHGTQQCAGHPLPSPCPCLPSPSPVDRFRFFSRPLPLPLGVPRFPLLSPSLGCATLPLPWTRCRQVARMLHCTRLRPFTFHVEPRGLLWSLGPLVLLARPASLPLPYPLPLPTLCRTLCWQFARTLQASTWPLPLASDYMWCRRRDSTWRLPAAATAPEGATPNAAGGAALTGPNCLRSGFHCTPRGAWSPGRIHHNILQESEKK